MSFGNWLWPLRRRQLFSAASASLKIMASAVLLERHPLERTVRWRIVANELSMTLVVRRCSPVLGREVVEGKQRIAILGQAVDRVSVFDAPGFDEGVESDERLLLGLGHPDLLQRPLGLRLLALGQFVEDIGGFVHPAALATRLRPHFFERLPEAQRAVGDRKLGPDRKPAPLQVEEELAPRLRALAHAIDEADEFLLAFRRGADDDQQALRLVLE